MNHADLLKLLLPAVAYDTRAPNLSAELSAEGNALDAVQLRAADLLRETDPRTTIELLSDWERSYGLPDPCVLDVQSVQQRRTALLQKIVRGGGISRQFFIDMAAELGFKGPQLVIGGNAVEGGATFLTLEPSASSVQGEYDGMVARLLDASNRERTISVYGRADYLALPGTAGNSASTPDSAAISIVGDLEIRVKCSLVDWTPPSTQPLIGKTSTLNRSYKLELLSSGVINLQINATGLGGSDLNCFSIATGFSDGSTNWIKAAVDVDNGAGGHDTFFYTSPDGVAWTQLGTTQTLAGVATIFDGTAPLYVGEIPADNIRLNGKVYYAEVRRGINGPIAASFDASDGNVGDLTVASSRSGEVWAINVSGAPAAQLGGFRQRADVTPRWPLNYLLRSQELADPAWGTVLGASVTSATGQSPLGGPSDTVNFNTTNGNRIQQITSLPVPDGALWRANFLLRGSGTMRTNCGASVSGNQSETIRVLTPDWKIYSEVITFAAATGNVRAMLIWRTGDTATACEVGGAWLEPFADMGDYVRTFGSYVIPPDATTDYELLDLDAPITITEYPFFTCESECEDPIYDETWLFAWQMNLALENIRDTTCEDPCDDPIRAWGNDQLECVIERAKPAHTFVEFAYS